MATDLLYLCDNFVSCAAKLSTSIAPVLCAQNLNIQPCFWLHPITRNKSNKEKACGWYHVHLVLPLPAQQSHDSLWMISASTDTHTHTHTIHTSIHSAPSYFLLFLTTVGFKITLMTMHDCVWAKNVHSKQRDTCVILFSFIFLPCSCTHLRGREMFLLGSGTGFPFMSVFDIRDMLWS